MSASILSANRKEQNLTVKSYVRYIIYEGTSFSFKMGQFGLEENADYLKTKLCRIGKTINRNFNVNITRIKSLIF